MKILIIGVNGFIGSNLTQRILNTTNWEVYGMDINRSYIKNLEQSDRFHYTEGDIAINNEWIEYHIKKCDVILPLVAIATPKKYVTDPLEVFELDFEQNLKIVRWAHQYKKRLIFPSTSEVYGMSQDAEFNESKTNFVYGPIHKTRWIYACSKQLLDRIIYAYGRDYGLRYTCFRPFNWIGPKLDNMGSARVGNSRVLTQFISNLIEGRAIQLVDGGEQKRCFTHVEDGLDCLMSILNNEELANGHIVNIGDPKNVSSVRDLAMLTRQIFAEQREISIEDIPEPEIVTEKEFYGNGFQDITHRLPCIDLARQLFSWEPRRRHEDGVRSAVAFFINHKGDDRVLSRNPTGM
ncbi:NAD-dependent epimerase/dehydratase family protein [Oleiphilus messinensis]|uniref:NAD-dependent epimerase/dehydratase family protein n=1 Tax=Oleiphilus messinensis TaxID=141451 RepID=A0A1Y0I8W2_9GAMM|nr:bifunctional UDP-4-keto-pentose/UDP-xylose synthase [Oleiphilus messinensis]ARU56901.1 NAD-dependent epimerase/dehydratase family protein [Oleiphilus messinensis]